jgi:DNA-binding NarL/FixJ family response regulator
VRQALKLLIDGQSDMQVVAEAGNGASAIEQIRKIDPDLVVMDLAMPDMNGLVATRLLKQERPALRILTLTRYRDGAYLQQLLRAGTSGYVLKQSPSSELLQGIRAVAAGRQYLDSSLTEQVTRRLLSRELRSHRDAPLVTDRESEVLRLIAWGHSNKEIAAQLEISVKTVEVHKANAMRKLNLNGRIDIVKYAVIQGWLHET